MPIKVKTALRYLNKGFSVFPVVIFKDENGKIQKKPAVQWKDYIDRLPSKKEVEKWFGKNDYDGIGVATGDVSGIVVIDVEADAEKETVEKYRSPMATRTISGGWHFYFRANGELRNTVRINNKLVDFRGDGGFVVLPPSGLGDQKYSWHSGVSLDKLPPLPYEIVKQLKRKDIKGEPVFNFNGEYPYPEGEEGSRNHTLAQVVGSVISRLPKEQWDVMGWATVVDWNEKHCHPPLPEFEIRQTWDSIKNTHQRTHKDEKELDKYKIFTGKQVVNEYRRLEAEFGDGLTTGIPDLDKFFTLIPQQVYLVSAPTHQGKTTLALNMCAQIASYGHRVLFASLEQGVFIAPRVESIMNGDFPDTLSVLVSNELLTVPGIIKVIESMTIKPDFVMIDHLHFVEKDKRKNKTDAIDDMLLELQNMAKKLNIPLGLVAHMRKLNGERPPELDDLRDSSYLQQVPSVVLLLYRQKDSDMSLSGSYLEKNGALYIAKNRISGSTGVTYFQLQESGRFDFGEHHKPKPPPEPEIARYKPKHNVVTPSYSPYND